MKRHQLVSLSAMVGLIATLSLPLSAQAQTETTRTEIEVAALGPQVGDTVPAFALPDQHGQLQSLDSIKGPNGTMLLFHRSADW